MDRSRAYFLTTAYLGFDWWSIDDAAPAKALWGDPKVTALIGGPFSEREIEDRLPRENRVDARFKGSILADLSSSGWSACGMCRPAPVLLWRSKRSAPKLCLLGIIPRISRRANVLGKLGFNFTHEEFYQPTGLMHPSYLLRPADRSAGS